MIIEFFAEIEPEAKGRPRFSRRGRFVHTYTPEKTVMFEDRLRNLGFPHRPSKPFNSPLSVTLTFAMQKQKRSKAVDGTPHIIKPDLDNLVKSALDPFNGIFWKDDSLIYHLSVSKQYFDKVGIHYRIQEIIPFEKMRFGKGVVE